MGIDLSHLHVRVPQQFLDHANIGAGLEQMSSKRVPKGMAGDPFADPRLRSSLPQGLLQVRLIQMMPSGLTAARISREVLRRKDVLPFP